MKKSVVNRFMALGMSICLLAGVTGCGQNGGDNAPEQDGETYEEDAKESAEKVADTTSGADSDQTESDGEYTEYEVKGLGMKLALPPEYDNTDGIVTLDCNDVTGSEGVYYAVMSYVGISSEEIEKMFSSTSPTEEDSMRYLNSRVPMFSIVASAKERSTKELVDLLHADGMTDAEESDLTLIKSVDGSNYYDYSRLDTSNLDNLDKAYQDEYNYLAAFRDNIYEKSIYSKPISAAEDVPGTKVSFTTTDFDGNTVTSEELFSKYDVTMLNVWATWCKPCVKELEELEKINKNLEKKNCVIIGFCGDATDPETLEQAKELLESKGVTYLNLVPFEGWRDQFLVSGWPSSFFIGKDGTILDAPIYGAAVSKYESYVDDILAGKDTAVIDGEDSFENDENAYVIQVVDQDGNPIENSMVQYCTNDMCQLKATDKDGKISFNDPEGVYEIHILTVPDGYEENKEVYKTEDHYSSMIITINKK